MANMPGRDMSKMGAMPSTGILGVYPMTRDGSGTTWQPDAAAHNAIHTMIGDWMLMGHLMLTGIYDTQDGPRGADKAFVEGMIMGAARRDLANGDALNLRLMLSPDPLMGRSGYPLLLATGETADGSTPLIDRQHPHDLFMELAASYAHRIDTSDSAFLYAGYPGDPALGPPAFMHRASGMDIPEAPIAHHWLDSTHITFGVLTAGFVHDDWKLEVSQFTGREPDQNRYDFDSPRLDSIAGRVSWNPDTHWSLQVSYGHLKSPEQLSPQLDEDRTTASATYATNLGEESSIVATIAWGLKRLSDGTGLNGALIEAEYKPVDFWTVFVRGEWEESNEIDARRLVRDVGELTLGAIRDFRVAEHWKFGLGGLYSFDLVGHDVIPSYGSSPHGAMGFVRVVAD